MTGLLDRFAERARAAEGRVGAVVLASEGTEVLALAPDDTFYSASVIKLALVMTLYADASEGRLRLEERIGVGEPVGGSGILNELPGVEEATLADMAALAMIVSDNRATNRLIERVGIDRVNERLAGWGCTATRLQRGMYDLEAKARGRENLMTPRETARLLRLVSLRAAAGDTGMARVLQLMERNANSLRLGRYLPPGVTVAHKDGWDQRIENDVGIVRAQTSVVVAGFTNGVAPLVSRSLLGLLGLAAAELAGADMSGLPLESSVVA